MYEDEINYMKNMAKKGVKLVRIPGLALTDSMYWLSEEFKELMDMLCYEKPYEYVICPDAWIRLLSKLGVIEIYGEIEEAEIEDTGG